jgi:hypothetical protein
MIEDPFYREIVYRLLAGNRATQYPLSGEVIEQSIGTVRRIRKSRCAKNGCDGEKATELFHRCSWVELLDCTEYLSLCRAVKMVKAEAMSAMTGF